MIDPKKHKIDERSDLRRRAEKIAREKEVEHLKSFSPEETQRMLHELRVHQLELEMQNDAFRDKQVELSEAKERYFDLYNMAPVGYCTLSEKGLIIEANFTVATLLGEARRDLVNQPITRFILKEDQDIYYLHCKQLFETGAPQACELRIMKKAGTSFWAHLAATIAKDAVGSPISRIVLSDITERKRAEESLQKVCAQLTATLDALPDLLFEVDRDGRIYDFRAPLPDLLYVAPEMFLGKTMREVLPEEAGRIVTRAIDEAMTSGHHRGATYSLPVKDKLCWFELSIAVKKDPQQSEAHFILLARDITERKRAEEALRISESRYHELVDFAVDGILVVSPDGAIIEVNEYMCKLAGRPKEGLLGKHIGMLFSPESLNKSPFLFDLLQNGKTAVSERTIIRPDSSAVVIEMRTKMMPNGSYQSIYRDITERKLAEAEREALESQNLQLKKSESLGRMSGAIGHHFNNQLHVVIGYLEMVIGEMTPGDPRIEKLTIAMQAARKASDVSILLITYLGQKAVKLESVDLSELCRISLPILRAGKPECVVLETDLTVPGPVINVDVKQIQQLLSNLVINAWEAIVDGRGIVRLSIRTVTSADIPALHRFPVDWRSRGQQYACLEVADSGSGIKEEDIDKLFDPFFSTKFIGRGLGLPVVLGIAKSHDAVVTAENRIGGGVVFSVFFPLSVKIATQAKNVAKAPKVLPGSTVLLVEDEEEVRKMTTVMLKNLGFTVLQAKDGLEAVDVFEQHKDEISCLLCDLTMPHMDGWETIAVIRSVRHDLPVVLASGYDEDSVMMGEHTEQPDFFLNKPYTLKKLGDTVCKAIRVKKESDR
jgi:PAS domain S-box-containing protein